MGSGAARQARAILGGALCLAGALFLSCAQYSSQAGAWGFLLAAGSASPQLAALASSATSGTTGAAAAASTALVVRVQTGTVTSNGNGTILVPISDVALSDSFLIFQSTSDGDRPPGMFLAGGMASGTSLAFIRASDMVFPEPVPINIRWYVVTYPPNTIRVQHGQIGFPNAANSLTIPISDVDITQSMVLWSRTALIDGQGWDFDDPTRIRFQSSTNLLARIGAVAGCGTANCYQVAYQVVQWLGAGKMRMQQFGPTALNTPTLSANNALTAVNPARSFAMASFSTTGSHFNDLGARSIEARLVGGGTQVDYNRQLPGDADDLSIVSQVVELNDGSTVQSGTVTIPAGQTQTTVNLGAQIDTTASVAFLSGQNVGGLSYGSTDYAGNDILGTASALTTLTSTQLTLTRGSALGQATFTYYVVQFGK